MRGLRADPLQLLGTVSFVLVVVVAIWQLPHFLAGNSTIWPQYANAFGDMLFYTAWTFTVLLLLTALTRTVSLRVLLAFWFLGVFAVHGLLVALGTPFIDSLGTDGVSIWVAPINQTLIVSFAVLSFYVLATFRRGTHPTVSDGLLVGFATGAGIGFHEDMTYSRLMPIGPGAEYGSAGALGRDIWWSYVFPLIGWAGDFNIRQFGNGLVGAFTLYHPGWGALLGVGIGFAYVNRHNILAWFAALLAMAVSYFEHMSNNWRAMTPLNEAGAPIVGDLFTSGDVTGSTELAVYILLFAIAGGIVADLHILRRTANMYDAFPGFSLTPARAPFESEREPLIVVKRLRAVLAYARYRRAVLMGLWRVENAPETENDAQLDEMIESLYGLGRRSGVMFGIVGTAALVTIMGAVLLSHGGFDPFESALSMCAPCAPSVRFMDPEATIAGSVGAIGAAGLAVRSSSGKSDSSNGKSTAPSWEDIKRSRNVMKRSHDAATWTDRAGQFVEGYNSGEQSIASMTQQQKRDLERLAELDRIRVEDNTTFVANHLEEYSQLQTRIEGGVPKIGGRLGPKGAAVVFTAPLAAATAMISGLLSGIGAWIANAFPYDEAGKVARERTKDNQEAEQDRQRER